MMFLRESCGEMPGETQPDPRLLQDDYSYAHSPMVEESRSEITLSTVIAIATSSFPHPYRTCLGGYIKV